MTKPLSWGGRIALCLLLPVSLLPLFATMQRSAPEILRHRFQDWSTRHVIYSQSGTSSALEAARSDPRALFRWRELERQEIQRRQALASSWFPGRGIPRRFPHRAASTLLRDWSINLGRAGTAPSMYPAKFTFDVTASPSCSNDFVVFPVNAAGSATQANIVAFNELYSGTAGDAGLCNRTPAPSDSGVAATVLWAYNVQSAINGGVPGSPVLSLDGAKVAFVESAVGKQAHFHVLAWKTGDGKLASNLQQTMMPVTISSFSATAPAAGSGKATDLVLATVIATGSDTLSSPYIDYTNDVAYVGNDRGYLFRIKNVFCTTAACGTAQPSLDPTWGTAGAVAVGSCGGQLTAPVLDSSNLTIYVGCSDGKLYAISQAGTVNALVVGDGIASKTYGGIVDPPVVDSVNGFVYVVSGSANNGVHAVLVQAKADLSSSVAAPIGVGNQCNMHAPTPNNAYLTSITSAGSLMYVGGLSATGAVTQPCTSGSTGSALPALYGAGFNSTGVMDSGTPTNAAFDNFGGTGREFAPLSEFFNTTTSIDWLFASALQGNQQNIASLNITGGFLIGFNGATEGIGSSGIIVDNNANTTTYPQAASIYFNALQENAACNNNTNGGGTGGCAVKLTQATLQ